MAGLENYDCEGTVTIGGVSMNRPAWALFGDEQGNGGLLPLIFRADQRGEDRILPFAGGVVPFQRRTTATRHDFRLTVTGDVDSAGAVNVDSEAGLVTNLAYLWTNIVKPTALTDGTRTFSYTAPGGTVRTGTVHVLGLEPVRYHLNGRSSIFVGVLQVSIPAGLLTLTP